MGPRGFRQRDSAGGTGAMVAESLATATPSGRVRHGDCIPAGGEQQPIDTRRRVSGRLVAVDAGPLLVQESPSRSACPRSWRPLTRRLVSIGCCSPPAGVQSPCLTRPFGVAVARLSATIAPVPPAESLWRKPRGHMNPAQEGTIGPAEGRHVLVTSFSGTY